MNVLVEHSGRKGRGKPPLQTRLIVKRKDEKATQKAQKAARRAISAAAPTGCSR
ncbi:hypothetical protein X769_31670 [Mesorhizobium sp. LSJC268A00]|nr:hypothetical protein X769_31670 [Mesorhizobium sp. LSJC268A00]ESX21391.1 hypothetical protein X767_19445 [Mesorhizobium sp. LSJC264A00]